MGFGWQEIDKTLDLGYIRVAGLHRECKPGVLFDPPNFCPRTMTHVCTYVRMYVCMCIRMYVYMYYTYVCITHMVIGMFTVDAVSFLLCRNISSCAC